MNIISYGLDYARFKIFSEHDVRHTELRLPYIDVKAPWFHGTRFVDLTGSDLAVIRMLESVDELMLEFASLYPVSRLDVYVDVEGLYLDSVTQNGTVIMNAGNVETIYSHHLKTRGDKPIFARAYDACAAGHYDFASTRFEVEFKRHNARAMLSTQGWGCSPIGAALHSIKMLLGISIWIEDIAPIEMNAKQERYQHDRERFYARYGNGIYNDIQSMGIQGLQDFIVQCVRNKHASERGQCDAIDTTGQGNNDLA